jgi:hypothetical protein
MWLRLIGSAAVFVLLSDRGSMTESEARLNNDEFVRELAAHDREFLLWELEARSAMCKLSFVDVVVERNLEDEPLDEQVDTYVGDLDTWFEEMAKQDQYTTWIEYAEREYGGLADEIAARFDPADESDQPI